MKKYLLIYTILSNLFYLSAEASSIDHSAVLGFNGIYRENRWTPLIIRLSNDNRSISGRLVVETDNSSTATEQNRKYIKPVDLPSGSYKEFSFVLPIGHHNKDLHYYLESEGKVLFEDTIALKQRGIKQNFILGISPYPDLAFLKNHPGVGSRTISYPHIDNMPGNSNAFDAVDIISIHREMMDKLTTSQLEAISGWVSKGGVFVVWGGKSPSPSKWDILPSQIIGLKRIDSVEALNTIDQSETPDKTLLVNIVTTPEENKLIGTGEYDLISYRKSGNGSVFFISFDYSGVLKNWVGLQKIWEIIFNAQNEKDPFQQAMKDDFLLEKYIELFDNSEFTYLDRTNVALILFLYASASFSIIIFIRFRRKSRYVYVFIFSMMGFLIILSLIIFTALFNVNLRNDSFIISQNIIYHKSESDKSIHYKDVLIGSSNKSNSDITLLNDISSGLMRDKYEKYSILNSPEITLRNIQMDQWSSKVLRFERAVDPLISMDLQTGENIYKFNVNNISDYFIHNSFIIINGRLETLGNILPEESKSLEIPINEILYPTNETIYYKNNELFNSAANQYINMMERENQIIFCGFINDELTPLKFSNKGWKEKSVNIILCSETIGGNNEN